MSWHFFLTILLALAVIYTIWQQRKFIEQLEYDRGLRQDFEDEYRQDSKSFFEAVNTVRDSFDQLAVQNMKNVELLERLQFKQTPEPKEWSFIVGGQELSFTPLSPAEWANAMDDVPALLYSYFDAKSKGAITGEQLERVVKEAMPLIKASAPEADLTYLTVPEALDAIAKISVANGIDKSLGIFIQKKHAQVLSVPPKDTDNAPAN